MKNDMKKPEINKTAATYGGDKKSKIFVYLFFGDLSDEERKENDFSDFPEERAAEILSSKSDKARLQKTAVWKLLLFAAKKAYGLSADEIRFERTAEGKWLCDKFFFSLSHTDGAVAVVVAEKPCGIDVEYMPKFLKKCAYKSFIEAFLRRIDKKDNLSAKETLKLWTKKESVFKRSGGGVFTPKKIDVENENVVTEIIGDYVLSVATTDKANKENIEINIMKSI